MEEQTLRVIENRCQEKYLDLRKRRYSRKMHNKDLRNLYSSPDIIIIIIIIIIIRALFLGVKRPGREADHSPPSSDEVKE
jgi:hypothetical protein